MTTTNCPTWCETDEAHTLHIGEVQTTGRVDVTLYREGEGATTARLTSDQALSAQDLREGAAVMLRAAGALEGL